MSEGLPKSSDFIPRLEKDLRWVVCPVCHAGLQSGTGTISCNGCGRRYPVEDGIPVLLKDRAS